METSDLGGRLDGVFFLCCARSRLPNCPDSRLPRPQVCAIIDSVAIVRWCLQFVGKGAWGRSVRISRFRTRVCRWVAVGAGPLSHEAPNCSVRAIIDGELCPSEREPRMNSAARNGAFCCCPGNQRRRQCRCANSGAQPLLGKLPLPCGSDCDARRALGAHWTLWKRRLRHSSHAKDASRQLHALARSGNSVSSMENTTPNL